MSQIPADISRNTAETHIPEISIIMPIYNTADYLSPCLESILQQNFQDFELICVDDCSTDGSFALLQDCAQRDHRIHVLRLDKNGGSGVARNYAISQARGKYLAFVDSDDVILPHYLEKLYEAAETAAADVVVTDVSFWDGGEKQTLNRNWFADNRIPLDTPFSYRDAPRHILNFCDGMPGGKMVRRAFALEKELQFLPIRRFVDFNFIHGAIVRAERVLYTKSGGYLYRNNRTTSLQSTKDETPLLFWEATMTFKESLQKLDYFQEIKRSYINNVLGKVHYNIRTVRTVESFFTIFRKLPEICYGELEMRDHPAHFYEPNFYAYIQKMLSYESPEAYLFACFREGVNRELQQKRQSAERPKPAESSKPIAKEKGTSLWKRVRAFLSKVKNKLKP